MPTLHVPSPEVRTRREYGRFEGPLVEHSMPSSSRSLAASAKPRKPCVLRSDRPKPFCAIAPGLFQTSSWGLMTHAVPAEGATPDWRSPPSVGSGPVAIAGPCARVPGRYAEPRKVKNLVAHPWGWAIGSSTSAAQMTFDMVVCRRKARPIVLITKLGLQENGRPSPKGTAPGPGSRQMG
jgi:hypothetical protein